MRQRKDEYFVEIQLGKQLKRLLVEEHFMREIAVAAKREEAVRGSRDPESKWKAHRDDSPAQFKQLACSHESCYCVGKRTVVPQRSLGAPVRVPSGFCGLRRCMRHWSHARRRPVEHRGGCGVSRGTHVVDVKRSLRSCFFRIAC